MLDLKLAPMGGHQVRPYTIGSWGPINIDRHFNATMMDAVIWLLVTRNTRDFPSDDPVVRAPYWL
jgi:hypothetical protein